MVSTNQQEQMRRDAWSTWYIKTSPDFKKYQDIKNLNNAKYKKAMKIAEEIRDKNTKMYKETYDKEIARIDALQHDDIITFE